MKLSWETIQAWKNETPSKAENCIPGGFSDHEYDSDDFSPEEEDEYYVPPSTSNARPEPLPGRPHFKVILPFVVLTFVQRWAYFLRRRDI